MVKASDLFKQTWQQDDKKTKKVSDLFSTNNDKTDLFTSKDNTKNIKESLKDVERNKFWVIEDLADSAKWLFGTFWTLVEYWWTKLTNKNEDWWINDYKKYNEYNELMWKASSEEESRGYYQKMVDEWIINEWKYRDHIKEEQDNTSDFEKAKNAGKNLFDSKLDDALSPIMKTITNRYQINVLWEWADKIKEQYAMEYDNVMNAYNDTRDDRILQEWEKISKKYEDSIIAVTKSWAEKVAQWQKYWEAYNQTISEYWNKQMANDIVDIEQEVSDMLYKYTLERNFNDSKEYANTWAMFKALNSAVLWAKNTLSFLTSKVTNWLEEWKQAAFDRYDVIEELANIYEFQEDASGFEKTLGSAKWVGNWFLDSAPQLLPVIWETLLVSKWMAALEKINAVAKAWKFTRFWWTRWNKFLMEMTADNLVYDIAFQQLVGHPITWEEENVNLLFNWIIDSAQAVLQIPAKYLNETLRRADFAEDFLISQSALDIAKKVTKENQWLMVEELVLLRWMEVEKGTKAYKKLLKNNMTMKELEEQSPELAAKYRKLQEEAIKYVDRMKSFNWNLSDYLLTFKNNVSKSVAKNTPIPQQIAEGAMLVSKQYESIRSLWWNILTSAKVVWKTIWNMLTDWRISEQELRNTIGKITDKEWFADIVLWLSTSNESLINIWLAKLWEKWVTKNEIANVYNWVIAKIAEDKWDILKADEYIGNYRKNERWMYVDMLGNDVLHLNEVIQKYQDQIWKSDKVLWEDKYNFTYNLWRAYEWYKLWVKNKELDLNSEIDMWGLMYSIKWLNLEDWTNKTVAEKWLITDILNNWWIKIALDEEWNITKIYTRWRDLEDMYIRINKFWTNWINMFDKLDMDTYRLLYAWDILTSYKRYFDKIIAASAEWEWKYSEKEFKEQFQTWFEKMFENNHLKDNFNKDDVVNLFKQIFNNNGTFKDIEQESANVIIKDIMKEASNLDEEDSKIYEHIKNTLLKWHYLAGHDQEAIPVVNLVFDNIKWLKSLGLEWDYTESIASKFAELIVDEWTLRTFSLLKNNDLYKGVIAKLLLEWEGDMYYKQSLLKMMSQLPVNLSKENREAAKMIRKLVNNINWLSIKEVSSADKEVFISKVIDRMNWVKPVQMKPVSSKSFSNAINKNELKKGIISIKDVKELTEKDIDLISQIIARKTFINNNLPESQLLDYYRETLKNNLRNINIKWELKFSFAQWFDETKWVINLTLLWEAQLMQLLMHPDNMLAALISKQMLSRDLSNIDELVKKMKVFNNVWVGEEYQNILKNISNTLEWADNMSAQELVEEIQKSFKENWLLSKATIKSTLEDIYDNVFGKWFMWLPWVGSIDKRQQAASEVEWLINNLRNIINVMNIPGVGKDTELQVQRLYEVQNILERAKQMFYGNSVLKKEDFQAELNKDVQVIESLKRPSDINFQWLHSNSKVINEVWDTGTNTLYYDNPVMYDWWKNFDWKKIILLDTETTGLIKKDKDGKIVETPDIWMLSYRVWDNWEWKSFRKVYKTEKNPSEFMKEFLDDEANAALKAEYEWATETLKWSKDIEELNKLLADENTYLVWHNIKFDNETLKAYWVKADDGRIIDTNIVSQAFLPLTKNHKQETLVDYYDAIRWPLTKLRADNGIERWHHDAEVDTLELRALFPFLANHAQKNSKFSWTDVLSYLSDLTKKVWEEVWEDGKPIITANALPFYKLESNFSNSASQRKWVSEQLWDAPTFLNQFFGNNPTRQGIKKEMKEINKLFKGKNKTLTVHDVVDLISDKIWDERSLYILNELKNSVDLDAVIDVDKVLIWEETVNAYIIASQTMPLTFSEFCTNRLVANILATNNKYDEKTIESLNRLLKPRLVDVSYSKLVEWGKWTNDTTAALIVINKLAEEWYINIPEKTSAEYTNFMRRLMWQLRSYTPMLHEYWTTNNRKVLVEYTNKVDKYWHPEYHIVETNLDTLYKGGEVVDREWNKLTLKPMLDIKGNKIELAEWVVLNSKWWIEIPGKVYEDWVVNDVASLNRAIYQFYKNNSGENWKVLQWNIDKLFYNLFWTWKEFEQYVSDFWKLKITGSEIWLWGLISWRIKEFQEVKEWDNVIDLIPIIKTPEDFEYERQAVIEERNKNAKALNEAILWRESRRNFCRKFWPKYGDVTFKNWVEKSYPEAYTKLSIEQQRQIDWVLYYAYARLDALDNEIKDLSMTIKAQDSAIAMDDKSLLEEVEHLSQDEIKEMYWDTDDIIKDVVSDDEDMDDIIGNLTQDIEFRYDKDALNKIDEAIEESEENGTAEVQNKLIEWQENTALWMEKFNKEGNLVTDKWSEAIMSMFMTNNKYSEFDNRIAREGSLRYHNSFLINELWNISDDYMLTSYNSILDIARFAKNDKAKDSLKEYLIKKYNDIQSPIKMYQWKIIDKLKKWMSKSFIDKLYKNKEDEKYFSRKINAMSKNDLLNYLNVDEVEHYQELKSTSWFLYNSLITLDGKKASLTPQQIAKINWFNQNLIWTKTFKWEINNVSVTLSSKGDNGESKELFNWDIFWEDFSPEEFLDQYMDSILYIGPKEWDEAYKDWWVKLSYHVTNASGKDEVVYDSMPASQLFYSPFWTYLLRESWAFWDLDRVLYKSTVNEWEWEWYDKLIAWLTLLKHRLWMNLNRLNEWSDVAWESRRARKWFISKWKELMDVDTIKKNWKDKAWWKWMWEWSEDEWKMALNASEQWKYYFYYLLEPIERAKFRDMVGLSKEEDKNIWNVFSQNTSEARDKIAQYIASKWNEWFEELARNSWHESFTDMILKEVKNSWWLKWESEKADNKLLKATKSTIEAIWRALRKDKSTYANLNKYWFEWSTIWNLYYKLDNYLNKNESSMPLTRLWHSNLSKTDKINWMVLEHWGKEYTVVWVKPWFAEVDESIEWWIPEVIREFEWNGFCNWFDDMWNLMIKEEWTSNRVSTTFKFLDMPEYTVKVEDSDWNVYIGKVTVKDWSINKANVKNWEITEVSDEVTSQQFWLHSLEEYHWEIKDTGEYPSDYRNLLRYTSNDEMYKRRMLWAMDSWTREKYKKLIEERKSLERKLKDAVALWDISENAEVKATRDELDRVNDEIKYIEDNAAVVMVESWWWKTEFHKWYKVESIAWDKWSKSVKTPFNEEVWKISDIEEEDLIWWWTKVDWQNSNAWASMKPVKGQYTSQDIEQAKQSDVSVPPTDTLERTPEINKELTDDGWIVVDKALSDPFDVQTTKLIKSRLFNFTNYDIYDQSKELQQITGMLRNFFTDDRCEKLATAINKFNDSIANLSKEEQSKIFKMVKDRSRNLLITNKSTGKWIITMDVEWLSTNTQAALNDILKIYHEWGWNPQRQLLLLSEKDWFETLLKNSVHNHTAAAMQYFEKNPDEVRIALKDKLWWLVDSEKQLNRVVWDLLWDPLGRWALYKMASWVRSLWRFIKYWPVLFPLSWVLMLVNSTVLWIGRYSSEANGLKALQASDAFKLLIGKKWDKILLSNGKEGIWLGFWQWTNRINDIMFNSNSDLWWTWFDKILDFMLDKLPENNGFERKLKEAFTVAMKGWTHSLFDMCAQWSVRSMELAKALQNNLHWYAGWLNQFALDVMNWTVNWELVNKILWDAEKWYSRFFTNSATTFFSRHKFSRMYMYNALQWYVINRTDEIFSSIKNAINWYDRMRQLRSMYWDVGWKKMSITWDDFTKYMDTENPELKAFLMNVLLSAKLGFYMDRAVNWWDFDWKDYSDYIIDTSDYLSSIPATFFYWILTAPVEWMLDYAEYVDTTKDEFNVWDWLTVAGLKTFSEIFSKLFREGKVLSALTDSVVAFGKTWNIDFSWDVLTTEFSNIANWLGRFQLVEWTNKYNLDNLTSDRDILWQILLNADKTTNAWKISNKMYALQTVDWILNWEDWTRWKDRLLPYLPVIGNLLHNSVTGQWYTFTQAKWNQLEKILNKDKVVQTLNNRDLFNEDWWKIWWDKWVYSDDAVDRMYKELTAFDYPNKARKDWTEFSVWYPGELEQIKETVFTDEILQWLWWTEEDLAKYLNSSDDRKKQWLLKIMAASEASRPGSSKIVVSYLANQYEYNLMKKLSGKDYPNSKDFTEEEYSEIQRSTLENFYPYMFMADKTSWYKAITEYVSGKYTLFKDLYKDDDLTWYLSTLGYMDMLMYQQAKDGNVNAKFIKNSRTMLSKYFKSEPARIDAISYVMWSIENSWFSKGKATSAKMWVLAANMDFYDKIQKSWMMQALYGEDIERYNNYVWWVLKDINDIWYQKAKEQYNQSYWYWTKPRKSYSNYSPMWQNNEPEVQKFVPAAQRYLKWKTPSFNGWYSSKPTSYKPGKTLDWYRKYYEGLISTYSDRLVKSKGKKYPAQTVEGITFKTGNSNKWKIKWDELRFKKHKSKKYRTNVISSLPGSHW